MAQVIVKFFANNNSSKLQPAMVLVLFLSGLALGFAARVEELLEVSEAVSEAVAVKQDETVQGVTYDEPKGRTCTSTSWTFCKSPAVWRGHALDDGNLCCLQGHYTCNQYGITGESRCNSPSAWTGEHCCTKVATTTTTTPRRLLQHGYHNGGYHNGGYNEFKGKACQGRNELGAFRGFSACQSKCNMDARCVSFEWIPNMLRCQLSTSCTGRHLSTVPGIVVYIKKSASYTMAPKQTHYLGCYINKGSGSARINGHVKNLSVQDCRELAAKEQKKFFGMEYPQGSSTPGQVQCLPLDRMPTNTKVADAECEAEGLFEGYRLGSAHRLAMYSNVAAAPSSYYYYYN